MINATEALFDAITDIDPAGVARALAQGADVNGRHPLGKLTPLHIACWVHGKRTARALRLSPHTEQIVQLLLEAGADPTARDGIGVLAKRAGLDSSCHMPAAWCGEGEIPRCLSQRMLELSAANRWPEPDPDGKGGFTGKKQGSDIARGLMRRSKLRESRAA